MKSKSARSLSSSLIVSLLSVMGLFAVNANAQQTYVYGHDACSGACDIHVIDADTGAIVRQCTQSNGNGRGIVIVGDEAYYTVADSGNVWKMNINTCEDLGVAFTTQTSGIATIAYTGSTFWINQYDSNAPGNEAYEYDMSGNLLRTVTLDNCASYCDGMEYFEEKLISNRGDAVAPIYDVYDLSGNLLTEGFINDPQGGSTTGIAYDGQNFWVSDIFQNRLRVYDGTTGDFIRFVVITGDSTLIEDLSVDYAQRPDTGGGGEETTPVPTLNQWAIIAFVLLLSVFGSLGLRRKSKS